MEWLVVLMIILMFALGSDGARRDRIPHYVASAPRTRWTRAAEVGRNVRSIIVTAIVLCLPLLLIALYQ